MKSIPIQQDNVTQLSADDFNEIPRETENAIESADITLSTSDLSQLAKSLAVYAGAGEFYEDEGIADDYILSTIGNRSYPPEYYVGQVARFIPGNTSTSSTAVAGIGGNGILPIGIGQLPDGGPFEIGVSDIREGIPTSLVVDSTPDGTKYFRLDTLSLTNLSDGQTTIEGAEGWTMTIGTDSVRFVNQSTGEDCLIGRDSVYNAVSGGQSVNFTGGHLECRRSNSAAETNTTADWKGIGFGGGTHPNPRTDSRLNKTYELLTTSGISFDASATAGNTIWTADSVYSTDIPSTCTIFGVTANYAAFSADRYTAPCTCKVINNGGTWDILIGINAAGSSASFEPLVAGMLLSIEFDGQNLT